MSAQLYLGCAIWAYKAWLGELFPPDSASTDFLRLYSRRLTTVEGNTTFYAVPKAETIARWAAETPESFRFCLKLPRTISHSGALAAQHAPTLSFVQAIVPLGVRLGPCFLQLPPGYGPARRADLARWLDAWPRERPLAVEVRHPDWYAAPGEAALSALLADYGAGRVVMDVRPIRAEGGDNELLAAAREKKPDVPLRPIHSGGFAFVRYIGHPEPEANDTLLDEWAARLANWLNEGITVYWFAHCPDETRSPALCRALQQRLERRIAIPPLPWNTLDAAPTAEQQRMF